MSTIKIVSQKSMCMDWLAQRLHDGGEYSYVLYEEGAKLGFTKHTMLRAAAELDITSTSIPTYQRKVTRWTLPTE